MAYEFEKLYKESELQDGLVATSNGTQTLDSGKVAVKAVTVNVQPTLQTKTITPTESQQTVTPDSGYQGFSQVTVNRIPTQYIVPTGSTTFTQNGTYDITQFASVIINVAKPTLNAPTISVTGTTLTITDNLNGNFVTSYYIYLDGTYYASTTSKTYSLSSITSLRQVTVKAIGSGFNDSTVSNQVASRQAFTLTKNATHCTIAVTGTISGTVASGGTIYYGETLTWTATADTGYEIQGSSTGTIVVDGNETITVVAVELAPQLSTPTISLSGDTLSIEEVENAEAYDLYDGDTKVTTITPVRGN